MNTKLTYEELLAKIDQLTTENKQLRLRPAVHSADAKLMDFMKIKSQLANAMLEAIDVKHAIRISIQYLSKIDNIHGIAFLKNEKQQRKFEILQEDKIPKKLLYQLRDEIAQTEFKTTLFPKKTCFYSNYSENKFEQNPLLANLQNFSTVLVLPIMETNLEKYSLLLISKKTFRNSRLFKIVYENIQAQLRSSYSRLLPIESMNEETDENNDHNFEKINKELLRQIRVYREQNVQFLEELELYKGIIQQQKDIIIRINKDGQILFKNPAFSQITQLTGDDSEQLINYFGEGDFPGINQILHDFEDGIQQVNCEIQLQNDYPRWYNFFFTPVLSKRGLIVAVQIVARDIDKIIRLEQKLELQKEMLVNMLDESEYLGFSIDQQGFVNMVSNNFCSKTGFKEEEILHNSILELIDTESQQKLADFLQKQPSPVSLSTPISFNEISLNQSDFELEIHPINCVSLKNQYFIGNLSQKKPAN